MTVNELIEQLQDYKEEYGDKSVVVRDRGVSIGVSPHANVNDVYPGFDWDAGFIWIDLDKEVYLQEAVDSEIQKALRNHGK